MQKNIVHMKLAEGLRNLFMVTPPEGTTPEDVQDGRFWEHVAKKLGPWDQIEVIPVDGAFYAKLIVISVDQHRVVVKMMEYVDLQDTGTEGQADASEPEHVIKWRGPNFKHCVMRTVDGSALKEGCLTKKDAQLWLDNHLLGLGN